MKVIFVRHGKDDDRYRGGWSDLDLIAEGKTQARQLGQHLKENRSRYNISRIVSSDLQRAMTTADYISTEMELKIESDPRIREMNNGDLAGMRQETALEKYPGLFFGSLQMDEAYPNGESPADFYNRIKCWFEDFCTRNQDAKDNILVVTHGGVINIVYHLVKGMKWSNKSPGFKASHCSIHILDMETMRFEVENKTGYQTSGIS